MHTRCDVVCDCQARGACGGREGERAAARLSAYARVCLCVVSALAVFGGARIRAADVDGGDAFGKSGGSHAYIVFIAEINSESSGKLIDAVATATSIGIEEIDIYISSEGGEDHYGHLLYDYLSMVDAKITTYNMSFTGSAAMLLFLAGAERLAAPGSTFFVHESSLFLEGNLGHQKLSEHLTSFDFSRKRTQEIFNEKTENSVDIDRYTKGNFLYLDAAQAFDMKITTAKAKKLTLPTHSEFLVIY